MKDLLIGTLEKHGYPVILHGTFGDDPFPDTFITFLVNDSASAADFDNETVLTAWEYQVNVYSANPDTLSTLAAAIRADLKAVGFIPQGKGRDLPADEPTHTGWTCNYLFLEREG